jgi:hypothetical protein
MKLKIPRNPCNTRSSIIMFQNYFPDFNLMLSAVPVIQECMNKERIESLKPILKASIWWILTEVHWRGVTGAVFDESPIVLLSHINLSFFSGLCSAVQVPPIASKHLMGVHQLTVIITDLQQINFQVLILRNIFSLYHVKCV